MAKKRSYFDKRIVISGVLSALSFIVLSIGQDLGDLDLTVSAIASLFLIIIVIEMGYKYAWMTFLVTSILAILLVPPPKTVAVFYAFSMGFYPMVKSYIERIKYAVVRWICKLAVGNVSMLMLFGFLKLAEDWGWIHKDIMPNWLLIATYALGVLAYIVYDIALTKLITLYFRRIREET